MYKQKIILFFFSIITFFLINILLFFLFLKYPLYIKNAAYWIKETFIIKEHRAETINGPKILIVSGSNTSFSICTPLLEEKTNKKIVNFGNNASTPIEIYFGLIKKYAKANDIIIMPLEYVFYCKDKKLEDWIVRGILTWGTEYIKEFSNDQILDIFFRSLPYTFNRIMNYNVKFPILTYEELIKNANLSAVINKSFNKSSFCNAFGDVLIDDMSKLKNNFTDGYFQVSNLKDFRFQQLKDFSDFLANKNIKLILTYPVTIQNPAFDLSKEEHLNKIKTLNQKFKEHGLKFIGLPELSNFEFQLSFNSNYHLNAEGAILRTLYFADTLNSYFAGTPQEIADLEEYKNEKKTEAKAILEEYRKLGYFSE